MKVTREGGATGVGGPSAVAAEGVAWVREEAGTARSERLTASPPGAAGTGTEEGAEVGAPDAEGVVAEAPDAEVVVEARKGAGGRAVAEEPDAEVVVEARKGTGGRA